MRELSRFRWDDIFAVTYGAMHVIALPLLACWLSLKLRRGAVAAAIALTAVVNILFVAIVDMAGNSAEEALLLFGTLSLIVVSIVLARRIAVLLPYAAAAD